MNTSTKRGVLAAAGTVSLVAGLVSAKGASAGPTGLAAPPSGSTKATPSARPTGGAASRGATPTTTTAPTSGAAPSRTPASAAPAPSGGAGAPGTYTGDPVDVGYGTVQVSVVMAAGKISDIKAVQLPSDRARSRSISNYAAPILRSEALKAQGANIDGVSGATYTSEGYAQSLQSAIDQARA